MWSSLGTYCRRFAQVDYLCLSDELESRVPSSAFPNAKFAMVPVVRHGHFRRFVKSFPARLPACVTHMADRGVRSALFELLDQRLGNAPAPWCIIENLAPSVFVPEIKRRYPNARLAYRSHDISELAFLPFTEIGSLPTRLAWRREVAKLHEMECRTLSVVDRFWTITGADSEAYARLHSRRSDGVFGVLIEVARYAHVTAGSWSRLLYLGSSDLRKSHGLRRFLNECWPVLRRAHPGIEFLIGGTGTDCFHCPAAGVRGIGYVEDEVEFLGQGRTLLNPQEAGSGIKLKSLVAMAARKLLISTTNGVSGIDGKSGHHFIAADTAGKMVEAFELLWRDQQRAEIIATAGRNLVNARYDLRSYDAQDRDFARLVDS
jgi:hypothetical protein